MAAATSRVGLGTTVLVLPMRNPLHVAKSIASIDLMSGGRFILGTAAGWLKAEFDAIGVPFDERGPRTDEAIAIMRHVWENDNMTIDFPVHRIHMESIRAKPQPNRRIPIWIGGHAVIALRRAIAVGDGWHGAFLTPEETKKRVEILRMGRPEPEYEISMRTRWDPLEDDNDLILAELDHYREIGVTHVVPEPRQRTMNAYLESIEATAELMRRGGVEMTPLGK